ncbi:PilN domain-containing protein [Candidatus Berkiella aquae]|uniref:Fimbrial assembly protein (PilN) n=1 Tax=Candidatus Berkiella aquae TaxID=295108 RepID=A0A0Q9YXY6_9GAMM|nr:PilN domain-containing protein [Candidatus Berkiella aquae]MCS5710030.1 PilN domain-containing protein [Candidatus Berkiella aquae]
MTININLLPWREERKELQKKEFFTMLAFGIVVSCGLVMIMHMSVARQIAAQNENNNYLKQEIKQLDDQIAEIQGLEKEKQQLLAKMEVIQQLQASRPEVVRLFDTVVRIIPPGLYLTNLSRTGSHILLDGKAESNTRVSTFMRNIEASGLFKTPDLTLIQADDGKGDKSSPRLIDRLIGFNLQVDEVNSFSNASQQKAAVNETTPSATQASTPAATPTSTTVSK